MKNIDVTDKLELLALSKLTHCKNLKDAQEMEKELNKTLAAAKVPSNLAIYPAKTMIGNMMKDTSTSYLGGTPNTPVDNTTLGITKDMVYGCLIMQKKSKNKYTSPSGLKTNVEKAIDTLFEYFKSVNLPVPTQNEKVSLVNWIMAKNKSKSTPK